MDPAVLPRLPTAMAQPSPREPIAATLSPEHWAAVTYGGAALGDARRTRRLVQSMAPLPPILAPRCPSNCARQRP